VSDTQPDELVCTEQSVALLECLREAFDGPIGVHGGTADIGFGIARLPDYHHIAPGWISTSREDCCAVSRIAGNTALNAAIKFDTSVVMGHTHRLGLLSQTRGYGGDVKAQLTGMEVGHLMNQKLAHYLKGGTGNWQLGFGLLTIDGQHVKPEIVPIHRGRFTVDGRTWEV
jgi:hypothetical protein